MIVEKDAKNVMFARSTFISLRYYEHSLTWLMEGNIPSRKDARYSIGISFCGARLWRYENTTGDRQTRV